MTEYTQPEFDLFDAGSQPMDCGECYWHGQDACAIHSTPLTADDCNACGHRSHSGQCVAGAFTVCGCDTDPEPYPSPREVLVDYATHGESARHYHSRRVTDPSGEVTQTTVCFAPACEPREVHDRVVTQFVEERRIGGWLARRQDPEGLPTFDRHNGSFAYRR
jgi:hypothetical protein